MKKILLTSFLLFSFILAQAQQENNQSNMEIDSTNVLKEVVILASALLGSKIEAQNRTGSAYFISPTDLKKHNYTDVNRILRVVPGVNIYEEDGFGLRPNISLRGTSPERSSKITLMEDGVLIAPAPYSAPAAYYFPSVGRMHAVEILKGSSQIQYGPNTTGGAINFISSQIPTDFSGSLTANYGSYNTSNLHANVGSSHKNFGYLVEYLNYRSDGFKDLDNRGETGFDKNDFLAKFRINTNPGTKIGQAVDLKFQYSDEISDETYLGLTQEDFDNDPFRRYAGSQKDQMNAEHLQFMAMHTLELNNNLRVTTTAYRNEFSRNWYKLDDVTANDKKVSISALLNNPDAYADAFGTVTGATSEADALAVKNNNREYTSQGIQTKLNYNWAGVNAFHDIEVGLRYHYDEEDRFQWVDRYQMNNGRMDLTTAGTPGTDANRISDATAIAAHALYKLKLKNLTVTPGLRYENVILGRADYGKNDVSRTGSDLSTRENKVYVFIPGVGFNYRFKSDLSVFGGVHKGFSPPGNSVGQDLEESVNTELGSRFNLNAINGELVGFYNGYSNLLGSDFAASGGTGTLDEFNAGEVRVSGFELLLNSDLLRNNNYFRLPLSFAYTYTNTEFQNSFESAVGIWGEVAKGDEMPYIPKHQFNTSIGLEHDKFEVHLSGRYMGEFRTLAGTGNIAPNQKVDANFVIDLAAKYHLSRHLSLTANAINLLNNKYTAARVPSGLRPGHPFGIYGGISAQF